MLVPLELDETLDRFVTLHYWCNTTSKFYPKPPRVDVSKSSYFCNHKFVKRLYHPGHFSLNLPYCEGSSPSFRRSCEASIERSTIDFEELRAAPRAHPPLPPLRSPHQSFLPPFHLSSICLGNIPRSSLKQLPRFPARPHLPPPIQPLALSILPPPTEHPLPILLAPVTEPPPGKKKDQSRITVCSLPILYEARVRSFSRTRQLDLNRRGSHALTPSRFRILS